MFQLFHFLAITENERQNHEISVSPNPDSSVVDLSLPSATERRRSLISERPKTSTTILRSYSSSSFESPDENEDSDWDSDSDVESSKNSSLQ